jgi:hypothetical protein
MRSISVAGLLAAGIVLSALSTIGCLEFGRELKLLTDITSGI